jgi:hypothetical protein
VELGDRLRDRVVIKNGLQAGERVVTAGTYALKARVLKSQIGEAITLRGPCSIQLSISRCVTRSWSWSGFLLVVVFGVQALRAVPVDAFPDVTPNQVNVYTESPGLAAEDVEKLLTFPIETAMAGSAGRGRNPFGVAVRAVLRQRLFQG